MPQLRIIASLWTLLEHPAPVGEWSLEEKVGAIKEAGFDGFTDALRHEHARLATSHGLVAVGHFASADPSRFAELIAANRDAGAQRINVQLGDDRWSMAMAVNQAVSLTRIAAQLGVACDIEVHRGTCTETPEKVRAITDGFRRATGRLVPFTWDYSHLAVAKHWAPPYWERLTEFSDLIRHARQFHFRPFNGHHCQVPVTDGRGTLCPEFEQWRPVLERTFDTWLEAAPADAELFVCPELGPVNGGYNLSHLPSSWEDAKRLRGIIAEAWVAALRRRN